MGFGKYPSMPAPRQRSRSPFIACAVTPTMGTRPPRPVSSPRIALVASRPSISGICTSMRMTSNRSACVRASASRPLCATVTSCPAFSRMVRATRWFTGLSSASRTRSRRPWITSGTSFAEISWEEPRTVMIASSSSDCLIGLTSVSWMPAFLARAACPTPPLEESMRMAPPRKPECPRSRSASSNPSMIGICASSSARRNGRCPCAAVSSCASACAASMQTVGFIPQLRSVS